MTVISNNYGLIGKELHAAVAAAITETASSIEQNVKGRAPKAEAGGSSSGGPRSAPYVTGNLRRSYHIDKKNLRNPVEPSVDVGSDPGVAEYAVFVEYGTSKMAPRPHLTPSSEAEHGPHAMRVAAAIAEAAGHGSVGAFAAPVSGSHAQSQGMSFGLPDY